MTMRELHYPGFSLQCPANWEDITDQVDADDPPITLADRDADTGALQFSAAMFESGELPQIDEASLRELLKNYAEAYELGEPLETTYHSEPVQRITATFEMYDDLICLWYLTDGKSLVFASFITERPADPTAVATVQQMLDSLKIDPR
ncbi:hypothetical protein [Bremerella cremea]|uniref:hypothetical protein n=1 Tax=Bremerella cremea TaxID=1031537 RepID=UPI0031F05E77